MLFACPICGVSFGPSSRYCPHCGEFEAPINQRIGFLELKAVELLDRGFDIETIEQLLLDEGVHATDARAMLEDQRLQLRRIALSTGIKRVVIGICLMSCAVYVTWLGAVLGYMIVGCGAFVFGASFTWSGVLNIVSGREREPCSFE